MNSFELILTGMVLGAVCAVASYIAIRRKRPKKKEEPLVFSSIEQLKAIGQLSVYKVMTKEIVTETDHTWGEFGDRYLSWMLSGKKMAMIFEFEIDFRYNLQSSQFTIDEESEGAFRIGMPPCEHEVHIRDIRFYDEQGSKLLPWLLPDLLNGFLSGGFSEEDKNRLVDAAKGHAERQALELIENVQSEVRKSAKTTLESISRAFGAQQVEFDFAADIDTAEVEVAVAESVTA